MEPQFAAIADSFVDHYYQRLDAVDRKDLGSLYRPTSLLSFDGDQVVGSANIVKKLESLPFGGSHRVSTKDAQPMEDAILVTVTGQYVDEESGVYFFTQTFLLKPEAKSYYIQHDIFRLLVN